MKVITLILLSFLTACSSRESSVSEMRRHPFGILASPKISADFPPEGNKGRVPVFRKMVPYMPFLGMSKSEIQEIIIEIMRTPSDLGSLSDSHFTFSGDGGTPPVSVEKIPSRELGELGVILRVKQGFSGVVEKGERPTYCYELWLRGAWWFQRRHWIESGEW